jgi:hypothetical protein
MTLDDWKIASEVLHNLVTSAAVIVGGFWVLWRFVLQRERFSRIEFSLELTVLGRLGDRIVVEPTAVVTNRGPVRHWLTDFRFDLHYLPLDSIPCDGDERINYQTLFQPLIKKRQWVPGSWISSFVDPGATQRFSYVTTVPANAAFLLLYSQFKYRDSQSEFHTSQKAFRVADEGVQGLIAVAV